MRTRTLAPHAALLAFVVSTFGCASAPPRDTDFPLSGARQPPTDGEMDFTPPEREERTRAVREKSYRPNRTDRSNERVHAALSEDEK